MSKIKNGGLDQYRAGPFERQQFGVAGVEGVIAFFLWGHGHNNPQFLVFGVYSMSIWQTRAAA